MKTGEIELSSNFPMAIKPLKILTLGNADKPLRDINRLQFDDHGNGIELDADRREIMKS